MSYTPWQWAAMATLATLVLFLLQLLVISTLLPSAEPLLPPLEEEAELAPWHEELQQLTKRLEGLEASSRTAGELEARGEARVLELEGRLDRSTARLGQVEARVGEVATLARGQGEGAREEVRSLREEMEVLKGDLLKVKTEGVKGEVEMKVGEKVVEDVVEDVVTWDMAVYLCPVYVLTQKPVLTSHILMVLSLLLLTCDPPSTGDMTHGRWNVWWHMAGHPRCAMAHTT